MTPGARVAAAIDILDDILAGQAAEKVLTNWGRGHRFAGSGDRAAIRDHVFSALRCRASFSAMGGSLTGRGLMLGTFAADPDLRAALFSGEGYAPPPITPGEEAAFRDYSDLDRTEALDCPAWLVAPLGVSLGPDFPEIMQCLRQRAPVFLRVNKALSSRDKAIEILAEDEISAQPHPLADTALEVTGNERRLRQSRAYREGLVELQDAASQAVVGTLGLSRGERVLDYCAGGGGKALAMAAEGAQVTAHDADFQRMKDLPDRAQRAGAEIALASSEALNGQGPFDLVLCDVPCSGSGAWRRSPEGKWALTEDRLRDLTALQAGILDRATRYADPSGRLAYVTCSLLEAENDRQIAGFLDRHPDWKLARKQRFTPLDGGDGFFVALMTR